MINIIKLIFLYEKISSRNSCDRWNQAKCLTAKIFWVPTKSSAPRTNALFTVCVVPRSFEEKSLQRRMRVVICIWHWNFNLVELRVIIYRFEIKMKEGYLVPPSPSQRYICLFDGWWWRVVEEWWSNSVTHSLCRSGNYTCDTWHPSQLVPALQMIMCPVVL